MEPPVGADFVVFGNMIVCLESSLYIYIYVTALKAGNLETANKLITLGAYTNILNNKGQTPLHVACLHAQLPIAELLVKNGANINVTDFSKETPVFKAVRGGNKNLTKFILSKGAIVNRYNKINEGLLHLAVMHDDIELVKLLLDNEEDPNELTNAEEMAITLEEVIEHIFKNQKRILSLYGVKDVDSVLPTSYAR
ncbi:unnamed protein product [Acanthoscelides obtectus]|uniref:Ankyrin repeat protein n=1 Tax=Acanthoscelides obtectus TaxID=200917 RepID=A0A9P0LS31_ACAOB|nr:unnamed protein product [Acanthoscelides obtectus]CAK1621453.1 Ankyrin-1 [Acanthoscelides obtectus]